MMRFATTSNAGIGKREFQPKCKTHVKINTKHEGAIFQISIIEGKNQLKTVSIDLEKETQAARIDKTTKPKRIAVGQLLNIVITPYEQDQALVFLEEQDGVQILNPENSFTFGKHFDVEHQGPVGPFPSCKRVVPILDLCSRSLLDVCRDSEMVKLARDGYEVLLSLDQAYGKRRCELGALGVNLAPTIDTNRLYQLRVRERQHAHRAISIHSQGKPLIAAFNFTSPDGTILPCFTLWEPTEERFIEADELIQNARESYMQHSTWNALLGTSLSSMN